jgi:EAL domain-containing protein (putative c-di-GMP-specific phosphodiesterase class I)
VLKTLEETGLAPEGLELELTESAIMTNTKGVVRTLRRIKDLGVRISIDDFGIGYSCLGYLKRLSVDVLKIDQSFVQDTTANPDAAAIVMAIISLAHNLRLTVIAEGVETEEQLTFLRLLRCDQMQGYLLSRPLTAEALEHPVNGLAFLRRLEDGESAVVESVEQARALQA